MIYFQAFKYDETINSVYKIFNKNTFKWEDRKQYETSASFFAHLINTYETEDGELYSNPCHFFQFEYIYKNVNHT